MDPVKKKYPEQYNFNAEKNHRKTGKGKGLIVSGLFLIILAAAIAGFRYYRSHQSEQFMNTLLPELQAVIPEKAGTASERMTSAGNRGDFSVLQINDVNCAGILSIDTLDDIWPVGSTDENISDLPCVRNDQQVVAELPDERKKDAGLLTDSFLIIMGMNYQDQFSMLDQLTQGDEVSFKDVSGNDYQYKVVFTGSLGELAAYQSKQINKNNEVKTKNAIEAESETAAENELTAETKTAAENELTAEPPTAAENELTAEPPTAAENELTAETEAAAKNETIESTDLLQTNTDNTDNTNTDNTNTNNTGIINTGEEIGEPDTAEDDTILSRLAAAQAENAKHYTFDLELLVYTSSMHPLIIGCKEQ